MRGMLAVIYLIFTSGHHPHDGQLDSRSDLAEEALRLGRLLVVSLRSVLVSLVLVSLGGSWHTCRPCRTHPTSV